MQDLAIMLSFILIAIIIPNFVMLSVIMMSAILSRVFMLSVFINAEWRYIEYIMWSVTMLSMVMLSVVMQSLIMQSFVMLSAFMLIVLVSWVYYMISVVVMGVIKPPYYLSVVILCDIILNVVAPLIDTFSISLSLFLRHQISNDVRGIHYTIKSID